MAASGAWSPSHVYTHADIREVVTHAALRGIRVIPEFDTPGHVSRGWDGLGVLTTCYDEATGKPNGDTGPLNPTLNATYDKLTKLYGDILAAFAPETFVHVGGDEVPKSWYPRRDSASELAHPPLLIFWHVRVCSLTPRCSSHGADSWQSNPQIRAWLAAHPEVEGFSGLETLFEQRLLNMLHASGASYAVWQEIFDNGAKVRSDTVIDVWKGGWPGAQAEMATVTKAGYHAVLSAPFYLNYISYGVRAHTARHTARHVCTSCAEPRLCRRALQPPPSSSVGQSQQLHNPLRHRRSLTTGVLGHGSRRRIGPNTIKLSRRTSPEGQPLSAPSRSLASRRASGRSGSTRPTSSRVPGRGPPRWPSVRGRPKR